MAFQTKLLGWFKKNARPLPWRVDYRPYDVWISEIMLQQTQMDTALPYFERWMRKFPDVTTLARSPEKTVLKYWQGLGYYSRARNLHASAKRIVSEFSGRFPNRYDQISLLKGVGPYTAGAIASIAFNENRPVVDGNVLRVLSRIYAMPDPVNSEKGKARIWELAGRLLPKGRARDFNQALMEFGALVCTPQNPHCAECPVRSDCRAFAANEVGRYPVRTARKKSVKVIASAVVISKGGKFYLHRRPQGEVMGGLWEFPEWKLSRGRALSADRIRVLTLRRLAADFNGFAAELKPLGMIRRSYTHHLESLHVFRAECPENRKSVLGWSHVWASKTDFRRYPFSSAHAKITKLL